MVFSYKYEITYLTRCNFLMFKKYNKIYTTAVTVHYYKTLSVLLSKISISKLFFPRTGKTAISFLCICLNNDLYLDITTDTVCLEFTPKV